MDNKLNLSLHPYRIMTFLVLGGVAVLFISLTAAYSYATIAVDYSDFRFPWVFHLSVIVSLCISFFAHKVYESVLEESNELYLQSLKLTVATVLLFLVLQAIGWATLIKQGATLTKNLGAAYLYVISGVHAAHILGGLLGLTWLIYRVYVRRKDPLLQLLFESDPVSKLKIGMLEKYWHFVDGLWIYLYIYFHLSIYIFPKINFDMRWLEGF